MVEYERVNLKSSNQQIKKIKEAVKSNNGTTLRIGNKNIKNNISTDIKLSKTQINKLIKEGDALGSILARFLPQLKNQLFH